MTTENTDGEVQASATSAPKAQESRKSYSSAQTEAFLDKVIGENAGYREEVRVLKEADQRKTAEYDSNTAAMTTKYRHRVALAELKALAVKEGIVDVDALKLLDPSSFEFDDEGELKNAEKVIKEHKTAKPHFYGSIATTSTAKAPPPANANGQMSKDEYLAKSKSLGL